MYLLTNDRLPFLEYPGLTKRQCEIAMQVFTHMKIDEDQKCELEPNLKALLPRICLGVTVVSDYFKSHQHELEIPGLLRGDKTVCLKDCYVDVKEL